MEHFDQEDVVRRLHSLGEQPVDPATAERHTSYLAGITPFAARSRRRPMVTAALVAGALLGGTGLAAALPGPLPTQAASVAKSALETVNLAGEDNAHKAAGQAKAAAAKARANGQSGETQGTARYLTGCVLPGSSGAFTGNHGAYVKAWVQAAVDDPATPANEKSEAATRAAQSDCGKPLSSVNASQSENKPADAGKPEDAGKPATTGKSAEAGKPATAGNSAEAGKPASPGKSDETHPPADAGQGAENSSVPEDTGTASSTSSTSTP